MPGKTLSGKLVLALLALFFVAGVSYVILTVFTSRMHIQEVTQKLHHSIAFNIVREQWLIRGGAINKPALKGIFTRLMEVNPSIEVYLLDVDGKILFYSAPPGKVKRDHVALDPIKSFLAADRDLPIRGDDPRDPDGRKVFSVASIEESGRQSGFLYIVLGGEEFDSVEQLFERSYIFKLSVGITIAGLLLTAAIGALSFNWLTRRLRRLAAQMQSFRRVDYAQPLDSMQWRSGGGGDEIDQLGLTFEEMSRRITEQIRQLEHLDAKRREMVAAISHDLRTPLATMQGYLETLDLKYDALSEEEKKRYLTLAISRGEQLSQLIGDLFELATLEAGDTHLRSEAFLINELVNDVAQKFQLAAEEKQLRLTAEIAQSAPFVNGDIGLMERVLDNLIENAIKFTPQGGTVNLTVTSDGAGVTTQVADSGPGIAEEDLPHIFEHFYQADMSRNGGAGAGLGLAIAQRILQLHGEAISVNSAPGAGTIFSFRLPACSA